MFTLKKTNGSPDWIPLKNSVEVQSFNGRSGEVSSEDGDYTFNQLDFTGSSIDIFANVDTTDKEDGKVLKWVSDDNSWKAMDDYSGIPLPVTTDNIDADFTGDNFINNYFRYSSTDSSSDFESALTDDLDLYYSTGNSITEDLDFGGQNLTVVQIDGVDVSTLYQNCSNEQVNLAASTYLTLPGRTNTSATDFLDNTGHFVTPQYTDLGDGENSFVYDQTKILASGMPSNFPKGICVDRNGFP